MNWSNISEIITFQIIFYIIIRILNGKTKIPQPIYPLLSIGIILLLSITKHIVYDLYYLFFFLADIFIYFFFPVISIKNLRKTQIIYICLAINGLLSLINVITIFISTLIIPNIATTGLPNIATNIFLVIIVYLLSTSQKFCHFIINIMTLAKNVKITIVVFIWEQLILVSALIALLSLFPDKPIISLTCFLIVIVMVVSLIGIYLLISNNLKSTYYQQLNKTIQNNMNEQVRYYEKLSAANENLRKFRHDFNNIKIGLNAYLKANDTNSAINYLNDCNILIDTSDEILHTGHHIVDALFSDKLQTTKNNNINIEFEGLIPSGILTPVDLCIIFGNTLDNAIEACLKMEDSVVKNINVKVQQNHDYVFITFANPCIDNLEINNNTVFTTKENTEMHGIGLYSIKQVLNKYDGHLSLHCENNLFTTEIDFCLSNK